MNNISRVTQLVRSVIATVELIKSVFTWEDKVKSVTTFIVSSFDLYNYI